MKSLNTWRGRSARLRLRTPSARHALGAAWALSIALTCGSAGAQDAPGGPALRQARAAWERGALETAEPLYKEAIEKGGLAPDELLEGYVRLGAIRASFGKRDGAIAAFRAASILDADFAVPSEAGGKGAAYASQAKRDTAKIGSIELSLTAPKEAASGKPFTVTVKLDKKHIPMVKRLKVRAKDGTSGKAWEEEGDAADSTDFEVSADVTLPGASVLVRVDALDARENRLATMEERVRVPEGKKAVVAADDDDDEKPTAKKKKKPGEDDTRKGGSFWSTPWPYVIGGVALAGAGAAVYFGTRPSDAVSVGPVNVGTR